MEKDINYLSKFYYQNIICQDLLLKQNYKSIMELPSIDKIVCNTSSKFYAADRKNLLPALLALEMITGQKAKLTTAHKSIAGFKLRKDQPVGCTVTLRHHKMYPFLEKCLFLLLTHGTKLLNLNQKNLDFSVDQFSRFPELQEHFELFLNIKGIQISFHVRQVDHKKYKNNATLLYSAFQLPITSHFIKES